MNIFQQLVNNVKTALGIAVRSAEQQVIGGIAQLPPVQNEIQNQIDLRVKKMIWTALPIALFILVAILLFRGKKS